MDVPENADSATSSNHAGFQEWSTLPNRDLDLTVLEKAAEVSHRKMVIHPGLFLLPLLLSVIKQS